MNGVVARLNRGPPFWVSPECPPFCLVELPPPGGPLVHWALGSLPAVLNHLAPAARREGHVRLSPGDVALCRVGTPVLQGGQP